MLGVVKSACADCVRNNRCVSVDVCFKKIDGAAVDRECGTSVFSAGKRAHLAPKNASSVVFFFFLDLAHPAL